MSAITKLRWPEDVPRLQRFLERCSDSYELHEGCATPPDAGEHELTDVPAGWSRDALHVLAIENDGGALDASAHFVRDYPQTGIWWIGLVVVAPELRSRGIGAQLVRHVFETVAANGGTEVRLVVSMRNPRAERFWEEAGFRRIGDPVPVPSRSGHTETAWIMARAVNDPSS